MERVFQTDGFRWAKTRRKYWRLTDYEKRYLRETGESGGLEPIKGGLCLQPGEGNGTPLQYSCLENPMDGGAWQAAVHGVAESRTRLSNFTFTFHFHALEKARAPHSSVLAWRIPGMREPGGLPSLGSHRVGHDWSDLAAAAAADSKMVSHKFFSIFTATVLDFWFNYYVNVLTKHYIDW